MNVLIVGANTKMAKVFDVFSNTFILTEPSFRFYNEIEEFNTIKSDTDIFRFFGGVKRFFELYKISKSKNIDLIFTNEKISMIAAFVMSFFLNKKVILLSTSHNSYAWTSRKKVKMFSRIIKISTDGYVSLSSHVTKQLYENKNNPQKILTTINPIEENLFEVKTDYTITDNILVIYVAVVYKGKGQDILLKAMELLKKSGISITVNFYGEIIEKSFYKQLQDFIKDNELENFVNFHGKVKNSELHKILHENDIYVCPSEMEMSPYNIIEAKAAGLPIVATNVGGIPDIITNDNDGLLIDSNSYMQLANAIQVVINDQNLRKRLGKAAFLSSRVKHSPLVIAKKMESFISTL